jgi:Rieske Fe-S protein
MDRKDFIKNCGFACMGGAVAALLPGCNTTSKIVGGKITADDLVVDIAEFEMKKGGYKNYLIVENEILQYPVCVYRFSGREYTAMFMRCTHQGAELQVFGDKLQCPAHGSEFNNRGVMQTGPASANLRMFPVTIENNQLKISLKPL